MTLSNFLYCYFSLPCPLCYSAFPFPSDTTLLFHYSPLILYTTALRIPSSHSLLLSLYLDGNSKWTRIIKHLILKSTNEGKMQHLSFWTLVTSSKDSSFQYHSFTRKCHFPCSQSSSEKHFLLTFCCCCWLIQKPTVGLRAPNRKQWNVQP